MNIPRNFILLACYGAEFCEGNFAYYLAVLLTKAKNLGGPFHDLTHMLYVTWKCVEAAQYYVDKGLMTKLEARILIIAALFHDFNHLCGKGDDIHNIANTIMALAKYILPEDRPYFNDIVRVIWATLFPYTKLAEIFPRDAGRKMSLSELCIRAADVSQSLQQTWMRQALIGLAIEWGMKTPSGEWDHMAILRMQRGFLEKVVEPTIITTDWGLKTFSHLVKHRIEDLNLMETGVLSPDNLALIAQRDAQVA